MSKIFAVVKHAGAHWNFYWKKDPKVTGVLTGHSAHSTYTGTKVGMSPLYYASRIYATAARRYCLGGVRNSTNTNTNANVAELVDAYEEACS